MRSLPLAAVALLLAAPAFARSAGIVGYSGKDGFFCTECHLDTGVPAPTVQFEGPTSVEPGSTTTYRFVIQRNADSQLAAGFDVAASAGTLAVGDDSGVRTGTVGRPPVTEVTHTLPRDVDASGAAAFAFSWTAPTTPGEYVLFGAGNSVNLDLFETTGDASAITMLMVTVGGAATPTVTPTATPLPGGCAGDCNGDGAVAINELITGVNIALGSAQVSSCPSFDSSGDGTVAINELIAAVSRALGGC
ncbi:MAG: choice-of-anchor V domain-containing protein [Deltaproteobacteria bacterium]|nr:choice-of-anchor V domain-containing protein [Deltaproteobacteria bacterium]